MNSFFRVFLLALLLTFSIPALAVDSDRMAGTQPVAKPRAERESPAVPPARQNEERTVPAGKKRTAEKKTPEKKTAPVRQSRKEQDKKPVSGESPAPDPRIADTTKTPPINTPQPRVGATMDRKAMESLGPLTNPLKGGLGSDMWDGTGRSVVQEFIPALPTGKTLRSVQLLARRVLLSNGDVSMMRDDTPAGQDLFTMRLEQLLAMGAYSDAVDLYTLLQGEPSHDRLAQAGIMALMNAGFPAQACLEARATHHDTPQAESKDPFWPQIELSCNFIQAQSVKTISDSGFQPVNLKGFDQSAVVSIPGSKVLTALVSRPDYRQAISSPADLEDLSMLERGVIRGLKRFDYSRLKLKRIREIPAPILMLMAGDPNMPDNPRAALNIEAARRGLIDSDQLGRFYEELAGKNTAAGDGNEQSPRLWDRYAAAVKAVQPGEKSAIVSDILENRIQGLPTALLPFASMAAAINPATLSPNGIRNGMILILYGNIMPSERWVKAWLASESGDSRKSRESVLLYLANMVPENLPTSSKPFPTEFVKIALNPPESPEALAIWEVFSGLGREDALYNAADREFYENAIDLTRFNDYVMPSEGFMEKLRDAAQNDRLGETALLAAVALNEYGAGKTHPAVLREVIQNLEIVGLKEDAQHMALGVILGLKQ